jgi:hypothetical protein
MLREMIDNIGKGNVSTKYEDTKLQKRTFKAQYEKPVVTFGESNRKKIEKRREFNLKKINKIKIKTVKI